MKWPPMASPGADHHNTVFQKYTQHSQSTTSGGHITNPSEGQETKNRLLVPQVHVKPIWRLEKKPVPPIENRNTTLSKILPQNTFYFFPGQLSTTDHSNPPLRTVLTAALHHSRCSNDPFPSTLVYQQSSRVHRPYQKLESLCLRSAGSQRNSLSPNKNLRTDSPANSFVSSDSAMSSSFVDQFNPPSAAGEPPNLGLRTSSICSRKVTSITNKPALNTNAFLRPNTATVPSYMSQETRKVKNPRMSAGTAHWHHQGSNEDETNCSLYEPLTKSKIVLNPSHLDSSALSSSDRGYDRMDAQIQSKQGNGDRRGRLETRDQDFRLTEAVRKLTKNGFAKNNFLIDADLGNDTGISLGFHNAAVNTNCKRKAQTVLHTNLMDDTDSVCSELNYIGANLSQSLANSENANAFPKLIVVSLLKSSSVNSDPVPLCRTAGCPPQISKPSKAKAEDSRVMNISAVATQISTIQLDKKNVETDVLKDDDVLEEDAFAARDVRLPDNSQVDCNSQIDGIEEELANGLEDCSSMAEDDDDDDDESDSFVTGHTSSASMLLISRKCIEDLTKSHETQETIRKPAFTQSIFPNVQPTLYFGTRNETVELLPWEQRKLLKWKMSTVTPNVVKQAIARSHFRVTKKNHDWLGCWGHHMKSPAFKTILEHQKLNHFPGSFQIGRKDRLWRNLSKMQARFGKKEFNFFPQTFVLPLDIKLLKKAWEESGTRQKWIVKPPASARGIGIQVIHKWSQLPKRRPLLVQRYLHKPYLISDSKFDLRIYVYVTSFDPLRVYLFTDGLVRFASCKYSSSMKSLSNKYMHLTNYSVNKKNSEYKSNADETACQGHKWALKALWSYLNEKGISSDKIWEKIKDIVIKTVIASEPYVNSLAKLYLRRPYCSHELFGFDIMLDENLKPWILEVNISPSLHSNSLLDMNIKGQMIRDLLNLAGFVLPVKEDITEAAISASNSNYSLNIHGKKSRLVHELFTEEKIKRAYYLSQKLPDEDFFSSVLDTLTPDDVRTLVETEDEYSRRGQFERVFPSPISSRYLRFFEQPRYLNILLNQWEQRFRDQKDRGLELLKSFCQKGFHTGSISDATPLWSAPRSFYKTDIHPNAFSKIESARPGKILSPKEKCNSVDYFQMQTDQQPSCFTSIHQPDNGNIQRLL